MVTLSLTSVVWYIMSTHGKAKPTQRSTANRSFVGVVMLCDTNDQICGKQKLRTIMITHLHILRIWFKLSSRILYSCGSPGSPLIRHGFVWLLSISHAENAAERALFEYREVIIRNVTARLLTIPKPEEFPVMAGALGKVCVLPRWLLWRGISLSDFHINICIFTDQRIRSYI